MCTVWRFTDSSVQDSMSDNGGAPDMPWPVDHGQCVMHSAHRKQLSPCVDDGLCWVAIVFYPANCFDYKITDYRKYCNQVSS